MKKVFNLSIYLPNETVESIEFLEDFTTSIGNLVAENYGNKVPEEGFSLEDLNSFIIIKDLDLPDTENFLYEDMYFVIPLKEEK